MVSVCPKKQSQRVAGCRLRGGMGNAGVSVGNHRVWSGAGTARELQGQ